MKTFHIRERSDPNGSLKLDIPIGKPDAECDIVVVVEPTTAPAEWLPDFWPTLAHGWQGEPLVRPRQGDAEQRESLR